MDKNAIRSIIIELRNNGNTYAKISDILNNKYDIKRSRQSVRSIYLSSKDIGHSEAKNTIFETNVDYLSILGYSISGICEILNGILQNENCGLYATYYRVKQISNHDELYNSIRHDIVDSVKKYIHSNGSLDGLSEYLAYHNVPAKVDKMAGVINEAFAEMMFDCIKSIASNEYNIIDNREGVSNTLKLLKLKISNESVGNIIK